MTVRIGYHASHEQFSPRDLIAYAQMAEQAGFAGVMSSEHIAPWSVRQGESGMAWAWLGAAMQATQDLSFGSLAIPGGWRYHPVVTAHAFATLAQMFPHRFKWIAAGSGEALNEHVVGETWPDKNERNARLKDAVTLIRSLWRGETVTQNDSFFKTDQAKLWSLPEQTPLIYGAALSDETARWSASWADGLITVKAPLEDTRKVINAFRAGGGAEKPVVLQFQLSWDPTLEQARANAFDQWRHVAADIEPGSVKTPEDFDKACQNVKPEDMDDCMLITNDPERIIEDIRTYAELGFAEIYLHNAGRNQAEFIALCKDVILPALR